MIAIPPEAHGRVVSVSSREAASLLADGVTVLDVRSPGEYTDLGHMPGAWLLPVDLCASAPALLPDPEAPVLVYCEHAVRSRHAAALLVQAGFTHVYELAGGLASWDGPRDYEEAPVRGPSPWLLENVDLLPRGGRALDLACGAGRHALLLASAGFTVTAIDRDHTALDRLSELASRLQWPIETRTVDLETAPPPDIGEARFDLILVARYLHRPLFPSIARAIAPNGLLLYETFVTPPVESRLENEPGPGNPAFRLEPGELATLAAPLTVLRAWEGRREGVALAAIAARLAAQDGEGGSRK